MTHPPKIKFLRADKTAKPDSEGCIAAIVSPDGKVGSDITGGPFADAIKRLAGDRGFAKLGEGEFVSTRLPAGLRADTLFAVKLRQDADRGKARKAGAAIGKACARGELVVAAGGLAHAAEFAQGVALGCYRFDKYKTRPKKPDLNRPLSRVSMLVDTPAKAADEFEDLGAAVAGVYETRNLVSEPSNVLTTTEFAARLEGLREYGLEVEILDEERLREIGMRALLAVGQASDSPSHVGIIRWKGGKRRIALVGKGVVFDTGGISLKPASGMEKMTMDMAGAGVVAGTMKALAMRRAKADVVGLVGLVENMPGGNAQRPGDIVKSLKGDTIEVINTDAEGRLVLADLLWYAQTRFKPKAMVDLATLTGAVIVGLGHEYAGAFSNNDKFCKSLLAAADKEGEGAWRLPLGKPYDRMLRSSLADMSNVGGRAAGSITGAQFLNRFVKPGCPWVHLDIAGVASRSEATDFARKGATGWGVLTLDRLVRDRFES